MKQIAVFFTLAILLFSCSNDDGDDGNQKNNPLLLKIRNNFATKNQSDFFVGFEYDNQKRLTKKIGGSLQLDPMTGYSGFYTDQLYTTLVYSKNKVTIENFDTIEGYTADKKTRYITLNNAGQIVQKDIPPYKGQDYLWYKRIFYTYSGNLLTEIKTTYPEMPYDPNNPNDFIEITLEKFYYDSNGNLSKTETYDEKNGISDNIKVVRIFEDYDNSFNYMKRFYLLEEYFYGSISKNNYRKYREEYYVDDIMEGSREVNWTYQYDSNGNVITDF